jgi:hypothetical protein
MVMIEAVQGFMEAVRERSHVRKLIENVDMLNIRIITDNKNSVLAIRHSEVLLLDDHWEKNVTCTICGREESINILLNGREKLRNLIRNGQLEVIASFRSLLLMESMFYLTKRDERVVKIIS